MHLCCSPHLYIHTLPICNKPLWRDSGLRWPLLSGSLLDGCIPRISPALWATSREMSLRRLLGSLVIFTTKQKRCQVLHAINAHFSLILIEPLVNQLEISTCRHLAHLDIYSHYILFLVTVLQLLVLGTPKPLSSCWVCRPRQPLQQTIVLIYMVDFLLHEGKGSRVERWPCRGFSGPSDRYLLWKALISHGTGKHDHTVVLLAVWDFHRNHCEDNMTSQKTPGVFKLHFWDSI